MLQGQASPNRRGRQREARRRSCAVPGARRAPAQIRCRACEDVVVQSPAPARLIEGGLPTELTVAHVLVSNTPITCRSTARRRFTSARESLSIARRSPIGSDAPPGVCGPCTNAFSPACAHQRSCSPTRRQRRCSIPGEGEPRPASSGPIREMIGPGAGRTRRRWPMSMRSKGVAADRAPRRIQGRSPARRLFRLSRARRKGRREPRLLSRGGDVAIAE